MKKIKRLSESQLYNLIEQTLNELDWRTYMNAAEKRAKQYWKNPNSKTNYWQKKKDLEDYAAEVFNKKYPNSSSKWYFETEGNDDNPFWADYNPIMRIQNGQIYDPENDYEDKKARREIQDYQLGNSKYNGRCWENHIHNGHNSKKSLVHKITESIMKAINEGGVADIYHDDILGNIVLTIENDRDCYNSMIWIKNALVKKIKKGLVPELDYLANCSTVRKIAQMAVRKNAEFYKENDERPPYLSNAQRQEIRLHIANLIFDWLKADGFLK